MGKVLPESLEREIAALTTDEKRELATMLRRMVADETSPRGTPVECPLCHHAHVVKKRRARNKTQRWKCRGCGRTVSAKSSASSASRGCLSQSTL